MKLLLEAGANKNARSHHNSTPLHLAVANSDDGDIRVVRHLVEYCKCFLNVVDGIGQTPLDTAQHYGNEKLVIYLMAYNAKSKSKYTTKIF